MKYTVLSLFPEITGAYFASSIMARAVSRGAVEYQAINIRDYAVDKHRTCDDAPYGGGPGMLMLAEPLGRALEAVGAFNKLGQTGGNRAAPLVDARAASTDSAAIPGGGGAGSMPRARAYRLSGGVAEQTRASGASEDCGARGGLPPPRVIYLSPSGRPFNQALAEELAGEAELILLCGRYEGIDQRIIDAYVDDEISVGDYVLSSGEAAALVVIDATYRLLDRVITPASLAEESFSGGLLEYPQYTRPEIYGMLQVPGVLLSGHHEHIRKWRLEKRVEKTLTLRPDLIRAGEERGLFDAETTAIIDQKRRTSGEGEP